MYMPQNYSEVALRHLQSVLACLNPAFYSKRVSIQCFFTQKSLYLLLEFLGFVLSVNSPLVCVYIRRFAPLLTPVVPSRASQWALADSICRLLLCFLPWPLGLRWWQKIPPQKNEYLGGKCSRAVLILVPNAPGVIITAHVHTRSVEGTLCVHE